MRELLIAAVVAALATPALSGDCTGYVIGVRPLSEYNHSAGRGFLAVRSGPGTQYQQVGEVYQGDEISVWDRQGSWYHVQCMSGRCTQPLWGGAMPNGWVSGRYLRIGGICP